MWWKKVGLHGQGSCSLPERDERKIAGYSCPASTCYFYSWRKHFVLFSAMCFAVPKRCGDTETQLSVALWSILAMLSQPCSARDIGLTLCKVKHGAKIKASQIIFMGRRNPWWRVECHYTTLLLVLGWLLMLQVTLATKGKQLYSSIRAVSWVRFPPPAWCFPTTASFVTERVWQLITRCLDPQAILCTLPLWGGCGWDWTSAGPALFCYCWLHDAGLYCKWTTGPVG